MTKMDGRRPSHNLLRDGYTACAEFIAERIQDRHKTHSVHVDDIGDVRLTSTDVQRSRHLPDAWLVGTYPCKGMRVEYIEDDLLARQRELCA